jgi:predicted Zn-dependent peptidase
MKKQILILAILCFVLCLPSFAQKIDRSKAPQGSIAPKIQLGKSQSFVLANGLKVYVVENHKLPQIAVSLVLDVSEVLEGEAAGYVDMAGQMLMRGTANRSKEKIDSEIDFIGATVMTTANSGYAFGLKKHAEKIFDLFADVLTKPTFPQEELDKLKTETLSGLKAAENDPNSISRNLLATVRFGKNHPYGEMITPKTVEKITADKLKNYHTTYFRPNVGYMAILGDINLKEAKQLAEKYFANWQKAEVPKNTFTFPTLPAKTEVVLVDKTAAVQSVVALTNVTDLHPNNPDLVKVRLMNQLLGGPGARLYMNLREDKGYTYGAYSRLNQDRLVANFTANASVRTAVTDSAVSEFLKELHRIRNEKVKDDELKRIKAVMTGDFVRSLEDPQNIANFAINVARYNMPANYYENYLKNLEAVTAEDVQAMAQKYIQPDKMYIAVVGDLKTIEPKLQAFGNITTYDNYGNVVPKTNPNALAEISGVEVLEKYFKAIGGKEKILAVQSIKISAEAEMMGMKISNSVYKKIPNKVLMVQGTPLGEMKQVFDGEKTIINTPMGKQVAEAAQAETIKMMAMPFPELNAVQQKFTIEVSNIVKIEGKDAYEITITSPTNTKLVSCYDKETGLKVQETVGGNKMLFEDYKEISGIKFPHLYKATTPMGALDMRVSTIEVNPMIADEMFSTK